MASGDDSRASQARNIGATRGRGNIVRPLVGLIITVVAVSVIAWTIDVSQAARALTNVRMETVVAGAVFLTAAYCVRIVRWWVMLRTVSRDIRVVDCAAPFLISIALNNVTPLRAGDIVRAFAFGGRFGLGPGAVGATILFERLLDLAVLLGLLFLVVGFLPTGTVPAALIVSGQTVGLACIAAIVLSLVVPKYAKALINWGARLVGLDRLPIGLRILRQIGSLFDTLASVSSPPRLAVLLAASVLAWLLEGGVFVAALWTFSQPARLAEGYLALTTGTLSTLVPSSPGYVGTFHYAVSSAMQAVGWAPEPALAYAILAHLLLWLPLTVVGLACLAWRQAWGKRGGPIRDASSAP